MTSFFFNFVGKGFPHPNSHRAEGIRGRSIFALIGNTFAPIFFFFICLHNGFKLLFLRTFARLIGNTMAS